MARSRFVIPDTRLINLSDNDWIEVKTRLTYGEQQSLASSSLTTAYFGGADADERGMPVNLDMKRHSILRIHTWVVDWSFRNQKDEKVEISMSSIESMDPDTAQEVNDALDKHIADLEVEKKAQAEPTKKTKELVTTS